MKKSIIIAGLALLCSCKNQSDADQNMLSSDSTSAAMAATAVKENIKQNIGTWQAKVVSSKNKKDGKLIISGNVNLTNPKAKVSLSQKLPVDTASGELTLVISEEPKEGEPQNFKVAFTQKLQDINKYKTVSILYNNKQVAFIKNIEQPK